MADDKIDSTEDVKDETTVEDTQEESTEDSNTEETEEITEDSDDSEEPDPDIENAKALYKALKNPQTAMPIIQELAKQAGLLGATQTQATKTILDVVAEHLGEEYKFLAPKIGPAIQAVVREEMKGLQTKLDQQVTHKLEQEVDEALDGLNRQTKGEAKKLFPKIAKLMDEFQPSGGISTKKYITRLYNLAKQEESQQIKKIERTRKTIDNSSDVGSRLSAAGISSDNLKETKGSKTIDQAIEIALGKLNRK